VQFIGPVAASPAPRLRVKGKFHTETSDPSRRDVSMRGRNTPTADI
jgi:hypothetical protein